ncbi:MFS transporter [Alkalilimnicola sp. S0819]|uniref:MFS transporter n=1 Tax=Alkalilimnicola sp. S0819 TaxID=2613922 RepID=UPI0012627C79|nr:MFS transporter [Alkalilimnicola sp. S0819]KAB7622610.1 MFS transporter [Alkalilimnicola sp. S0819]MPQ17380.1 MFS transporter [Alkalilimnicola sp. S0819]
MKNLRPSERLYALVANEEDARVCTDISEEACREVPGNFFRIIVANMFTKIGDLLINPKTVLAWLIVAVGAPQALVGLLVPIRESGSLIPQLLIGAWVRRHPVRKGFWVMGAVLQGLAVLGMALAVWLLDALAAALVVIALLLLFSVSRGFCSVAMKDVQGKCIPRARRGRLAGLAATLSGLAAMLVGLLLFGGDKDPDIGFYAVLLLAAGLCWFLAGAVFAGVDEFRGETGGGGNALRQGVRSLNLLVRDRTFRHFVIARAFLMASALGSPFVVVLAQRHSQDTALLGSFVVASALASAISASVWGFLADASSRQVMIRGGGLAAMVCLLVAGLAMLSPSWRGGAWFYPLAFFVLAVAHSGVRIGRKTYLVDMAGGNKRTDYTAVSNTVIGVLLLVAGGLSAGVALLGTSWALLLLGSMGLLGAAWSWRLPELTHLADEPDGKAS